MVDSRFCARAVVSIAKRHFADCTFPIDRPGDALILRSSFCKAFDLLTTIRSLLILNPVQIAIFGCRFSERPKKAFGMTFEVRSNRWEVMSMLIQPSNLRSSSAYFSVGLAISTLLLFVANEQDHSNGDEKYIHTQGSVPIFCRWSAARRQRWPSAWLQTCCWSR